MINNISDIIGTLFGAFVMAFVKGAGFAVGAYWGLSYMWGTP